MATNAKTLLHSVIIFNWTHINIVCVVSLFTKRASDKIIKYILEGKTRRIVANNAKIVPHSVIIDS